MSLSGICMIHMHAAVGVWPAFYSSSPDRPNRTIWASSGGRQRSRRHRLVDCQAGLLAQPGVEKLTATPPTSFSQHVVKWRPREQRSLMTCTTIPIPPSEAGAGLLQRCQDRVLDALQKLLLPAGESCCVPRKR
jgi:hypothetical protein